ncbi:ABC transporter permease [Cyclobacterium sp. 1_MG-2023]|uniref:ABC transporter permease n=1 Tax=Cyclobacterium sp. 1_MG-2023 TaxID=3062681 RepID=UPI0026E2AD9F|nr:ABC transporter permease [Cyclobacterium sp. 1_MG-2023]MDO6435921.1 ABC transporter permease [Cyclobacterium sp. 1_MG-2023]
MFKNYLKIAWRSLLKNKAIFSINTVGLALGIASCVIISHFVLDELSYDQYNDKVDQIARIVFRAKVNGEEIKEGVVMAPVAQAAKNNFPEVLDATRIRRLGTPKITVGQQAFRDGRFAYVDPNFFEIFSLPIIAGDAGNPLEQPNTVVITTTLAEKYFGTKDAIGKLFYLESQEQPYTITGVIEEMPENAHFHFDLFASMKGFPEANSNSWFKGNFFTYLLLEKGFDHQQLEAKLPGLIGKYMGPSMQEEMGVSFEEFTKDNQLGFALQALSDIHLHSDNASYSELEEGGDIKYVYIFSAIALFMLLIACVNFINLSTATATKRAKEVGIRKVLGADKQLLFYQFISEAFIASSVAMLLAVVFIILIRPLYVDFSGKGLELSYFLQPQLLLALPVFTLLISLLAGSYPAIYLSSFRAIQGLTNSASGGSNKGLRSALVVFQFVISAGLILSTLVVNQQMKYIQNKDLGYDREQLLVIRNAYLLENNQEAFKNELMKNPKVSAVTQSSFVPAGPSDNNVTQIYINGQFNRRMPVFNIDENYIPTMEMDMVAGRNFSRDFGADSSNVIINQTAVEVFGFGEDPIGKTISDGTHTSTVIGVVKDFHFKSLHQPIEPLLMYYRPYGGLLVKAKPLNMKALIAETQSMWNSFGTAEPFGFSLMDESYQRAYQTEQNMGKVLNGFALLTIVVACLGLFGLVTYTSEQRYKEIGIRKVLGASVLQVIAMLTKDFLLLVSISFLFAFPLGYYLMENWLQGFSYRIAIHWWIYALAGFITLFIAFTTIGYKSFRAASLNPIKAIKED